MATRVIAESAPAQKSSERGGTPLPVAGNAVRLNDQFDIWTKSPLPHLDMPGAKAFAATDIVSGNDKVFALICEGTAAPRGEIVRSLREIQQPELLRLLDFGAIAIPDESGQPQARRRNVVIYANEFGSRVVESLDGVVPPMSEFDALHAILAPAVAAIAKLSECNITHRAIRPNNIFYNDLSGRTTLLGDCVTLPPAYAQPALFETIESAMTDPIGRGPGRQGNDIYALGVTLLFLLLGHRPAPELDDEALLAARIANGSYGTLLGRSLIPEGMHVPIRGMLQDNPAQRWTAHDVARWFKDRSYRPLVRGQSLKASRAFRFADHDFFTCRALAMEIAKHRGSGLPDRKAELITWVDRRVGDEARCMALVNAFDVKSASGLGASHAVINARAACALDPTAPIRYKGFTSSVDGIGASLAAYFGDAEKMQEIAEVLRAGLPVFWIDMQKDTAPDLVKETILFRNLEKYLKDMRPGFGIERCLYELNPDQHCMSPLLEHECITNIVQLLSALERKATKDGSPYDRHVAAFIAARIGADSPQLLATAESRDDQPDSLMKTLSLFAALQKKYGPPQLPALTRALTGDIQPIIASYHHRAARKRIETELPQVIKQGNLIALVNYLKDGQLRREDEAGFAAARQRYATATAEGNFIASGGASDPARAQRLGRQFAAVASTILGVLAIIITTLAIH